MNRYKGRGHWFSPPIVQIRNGTPTISATSPDTWAPLPFPNTSSETPHEPWTISFPSIDSIYTLTSRLDSPLAKYYRSHIRQTFEKLTAEGRRFGVLVLEPTCLGAGGMVFVDPLFQCCLVEVVRASSDLFGGESQDWEDELRGLKQRDEGEWQGLPVLYDEG